MLIVPYSTWNCAGPLTERTARIQALPSRNSHAAPSRLISYHVEEDRRAKKRGQCQKRGTDKCSQRRLLLVGVTREDSMEEAIFELDLEMRRKRDRTNKGMEMATASSPIWGHRKLYGRQESEF